MARNLQSVPKEWPMLQLRFLDHYKLLDVAADANRAEIRIAFDRAIKGLPRGRVDRFLAALAGRTAENYRAAYEELSDVERRKRYDAYLEQSRKMLVSLLH
jgi:DnaJ-class molecular chaperone